jgi:hypothetical protein
VQERNENVQLLKEAMKRFKKAAEPFDKIMVRMFLRVPF